MVLNIDQGVELKFRNSFSYKRGLTWSNKYLLNYDKHTTDSNPCNEPPGKKNCTGKSEFTGVHI